MDETGDSGKDVDGVAVVGGVHLVPVGVAGDVVGVGVSGVLHLVLVGVSGGVGVSVGVGVSGVLHFVLVGVDGDGNSDEINNQTTSGREQC